MQSQQNTLDAVTRDSLFRIHLCRQGISSTFTLGPHHCDACIITITISVLFHELSDVEFGLLQNLHLAHKDVLLRKDSLCLLFNLFSNRLWDELLHKIAQLHLASFVHHDLNHFLADLSNLSRLSVALGRDLVGTALGERNDEHAD